MKKVGAKCDFEEDRKKDLLRVYRELLATASNICITDIYEKIVNTPSQRFWISEERTAIVLSAMMRGDKLKSMRPTKREMFQEIYRRAMAIRKLHPNLSFFDLAYRVVHQPAPKFYMSAKHAQFIILPYKKKVWLEERRKKLRFLF